MALREAVQAAAQEVFTIPTGMSFGGYMLVHDGIDRGITTTAGIIEVGAGRGIDLLDGYFARRFGWATVFGALADAALDKKASGEILDAVAEEDLIPGVFEDAIRGKNHAHMALTGLAKLRHPKTELSPTKNGKEFMFLTGMQMGSYALSETVRERFPRSAKVLRGAGHAMGAAGVFYKGTKATNDYIARVR